MRESIGEKEKQNSFELAKVTGYRLHPGADFPRKKNRSGYNLPERNGRQKWKRSWHGLLRILSS